jgi:D-sedoheptulose 7-phosphate isomerase
MSKLNIKSYLNSYCDLIKPNNDLIKNLYKAKDLLKRTSAANGKVILAGNGASASIASHVAVDLTKNAKIKSINFNESNLITCLANDYSYDKWILKALKFYADKRNDLVILISSSGMSKNIISAAKWCKDNKVNLITFSGFSKKNKLININKSSLNFWVNSKSYNVIETIHQLWLLTIVDIIIGKSEYKSKEF